MTDHHPARPRVLDGGEALLQAFERLGITHMFSSPGSEWSAIWEALAGRESDGTPAPKLIDVWHETLAVDMAMGFTLAGGGMQAVLLHAAVGLIQGGLGLLTATQMEVPMVVLSGESVSFGEDPDVRTEPQWYGYLSNRPERVIEPVVKLARGIGHASTLHGSVVRAGEQARVAPEGPVFLGTPVEHLHARWTPPARLDPVAPRPLQRPDDAALAEVAGMIAAAINPVIVVESAGRHPGAWEALIAFAETLGLPVIAGRSATWGNFPTAHPLWQGGFGDYGALGDADLVLLVSPRTPWSPPGKRPTDAPIVAIGEAILKPQMTYQQLHADRYLEGDVALTLDALRAGTRVEAATVSARVAHWTSAHDAHVSVLAARRDDAQAAGRLDAVAIAAILREAVPDDVLWVDETVSHHAVMRHHLPVSRPCGLLRAPGGLGQGLGLAIGAKMAAPERPVVCLVGDGSFLYNPVVQALGAARDHDAPILIVVFNNTRYQVMRDGVTRFHYPGGALAASGAGHGNAISGFDYERLADLFGFLGIRAETPAAFAAGLRDGLAAVARGQSSIINLIVES